MCVDDRAVGCRKPSGMEHKAGGTPFHGLCCSSTQKQSMCPSPVRSSEGAANQAAAGRPPLPKVALACPTLQLPDVLRVRPPALCSKVGRHRGLIPMHLVRKESSLTPR